MLKVQARKTRGNFQLDVDVELSEPGVIALFGPSGCGKSTFIDVIAGLARPEAGRIEFDGQTLFSAADGIDVAPEHRGIGYVFQNARLFPHLDVRGNMNYGARRCARAAYIRFDEVVALLNLEALLQRRIQRLSGGERQRVALARALLSQPRLLLLDEPLASLDESRRNEVLPYLEVLRDRLSIPMVYVSHQFEEVLRLATHVVLMRSGRVFAQGDISATSLNAELHRMIGQESVGAVLEGECVAVDARGELAHIAVGRGEIKVHAPGIEPGQRVRLRLLARDLIIATRPADHLSVRNQIRGSIARLDADQPPTVLVSVDIGGELVLARITGSAAKDLALVPGMPVWLLVKSVSVGSFPAP